MFTFVSFVMVATVCLLENMISIPNVQAATCKNWYNAEPDPVQFLLKTRKCPCRVLSTFPKEYNDGTIKWKTDTGCQASSQPNTCSYHKGAYSCYRYAYGKTGPGSQCCYNRTGDYISDPFAGAGTLDRETPPDSFLDIFQLLAHNNQDVVPWDNCCKDPAMPRDVCQLYYNKRPPIGCINY